MTLVWLRLLTSAIVLGIVVRPSLNGRSVDDWQVAVAFGAVLRTMNWAIYESMARIPLGLAVTIEFLGPLGLAVAGSRRARDLVWVALAGAGVALLGIEPGELNRAGVAFALLAAVAWAAYILLSASTGRRWPGLDGLTVASVVATVGMAPFLVAFSGHGLGDLRGGARGGARGGGRRGRRARGAAQLGRAVLVRDPRAADDPPLGVRHPDESRAGCRSPGRDRGGARVPDRTAVAGGRVRDRRERRCDADRVAARGAGAGLRRRRRGRVGRTPDHPDPRVVGVRRRRCLSSGSHRGCGAGSASRRKGARREQGGRLLDRGGVDGPPGGHGFLRVRN